MRATMQSATSTAAASATLTPAISAEVRHALDALHEGFMLFDASDRFVLANRKIYELFPHLHHMLAVGNSAETVFAQLAAERLPVATPEERARWLQRRLDEHRRATGAGVERDIDGRLFRITEIMCAGGYILTTYQDMTEVRGREHEEARKAALLQGILDCMAQGLVVVGKDLRIVASNRRAAELLCFPETLLSLGADFCDVIDASARRGDFGPGDPNVVATRAPERARTEISAQFERSLPTGRTLGVTVAPALGGRMAGLRTERGDGTVIDWLAPLHPEQGFDAELWPKAGSYPLLPFSNRIREGRFRWQGRDIALPAHPGQAHAMHGFGHARPWTVSTLGEDRIVMDLAHAPAGDDWPWPMHARQTLVLRDEGLDAELTVGNDGETAMPVGGGFHPFLARVPGMRSEEHTSELQSH